MPYDSNTKRYTPDFGGPPQPMGWQDMGDDQPIDMGPAAGAFKQRFMQNRGAGDPNSIGGRVPRMNDMPELMPENMGGTGADAGGGAAAGGIGSKIKGGIKIAVSSLIPDTSAGLWNVQIISGATWPGTTVTMIRDGVTIIPSSATVTIYDPESGATLLSISVSINGGTGEMTVGTISAASSAALTWQYGNILLRVTEGSGRVTDLLAGNVTVLNLAD